jgi:hypothetical protein
MSGGRKRLFRENENGWTRMSVISPAFSESLFVGSIVRKVDICSVILAKVRGTVSTRFVCAIARMAGI